MGQGCPLLLACRPDRHRGAERGAYAARLNSEFKAAIGRLVEGDGDPAAARLSALDQLLASRPAAALKPQARLRVRASVRELADALAGR